MKRVIDFQVSIAGQPTIIVRIEYESKFKDRIEILNLPYSETNVVMKEAMEYLQKEIGHDDYEVHYWWWMN